MLAYAPSRRAGQRRALVLGAGGFIGHHMVAALVEEGYWVCGADLKRPEFAPTQAHDFLTCDLRNVAEMRRAIAFTPSSSTPPSLACDADAPVFDEIYQFAADMGGAGFVFTGDNDARIMHNSVSINANLLEEQRKLNVEHEVNQTLLFYSSSACIYPERNQMDSSAPDCREESAYPANPDSEYGWEKLFSERLFLAYMRNAKLPVRVARYHNIFGPLGTWRGGREKAPAAICRKIAELPPEGGEIELWGDGQQTRTFLFVDECIKATRQLMRSPFSGPVNIGSEELVTIDTLAKTIAQIAGKSISIRHDLSRPQGVRGRASHNELAAKTLGWCNATSLHEGLARTFEWVSTQVRQEEERNKTAE